MGKFPRNFKSQNYETHKLELNVLQTVLDIGIKKKTQQNKPSCIGVQLREWGRKADRAVYSNDRNQNLVNYYTRQRKYTIVLMLQHSLKYKKCMQYLCNT